MTTQTPLDWEDHDPTMFRPLAVSARRSRPKGPRPAAAPDFSPNGDGLATVSLLDDVDEDLTCVSVDVDLDELLASRIAPAARVVAESPVIEAGDPDVRVAEVEQLAAEAVEAEAAEADADAEELTVVRSRASFPPTLRGVRSLRPGTRAPVPPPPPAVLLAAQRRAVAAAQARGVRGVPKPVTRTPGWLAVTSVAALLLSAAVLGVLLWPSRGTLRIELASPAGAPRAEIFVDGQKRCDTHPCVVSDVKTGTRSVKVVAAGFAPAVLDTDMVRAGATTVVTVPLQPSERGLLVRAGQPGVRLAVDGVDRGELPVELDELAPGNHHLRFFGDDRYVPQEQTVAVREGARTVVDEVLLVVKHVRLRLDLQTAGARVILVRSGRKPQRVEGPFPVSIEVAHRGDELVVSRAGHRTLTHRLRFEPRVAEAELALSLPPALAPVQAPKGLARPAPVEATYAKPEPEPEPAPAAAPALPEPTSPAVSAGPATDNPGA